MFCFVLVWFLMVNVKGPDDYGDAALGKWSGME